ncbi:MAG: polysaccharide deacetylase family protein [Candidatus Binatia bacterium]
MRAAGLPILTFHALDDGSDVCALPPRVFRRCVERLRAGGFRTVALDDVVACLRRGGELPRRAVVITFDDGYRSVYDEAFPVLCEHGMTATVFLTVGPPGSTSDRLPALEGRPMLAWSEIREMQRAGLTVGAHTLTHPDLTRLSAARVDVEMGRSKAVIEDRLGTAVTSFAYPYGRFDARSHALARALFASGCSDALGVVGPQSDPWALERVDTYYLRSEGRMGLVPSRWLPYYLRALDVPRRLRRRAVRWIERRMPPADP